MRTGGAGGQRARLAREADLGARRARVCAHARLGGVLARHVSHEVLHHGGIYRCASQWNHPHGGAVRSAARRAALHSASKVPLDAVYNDAGVPDALNLLAEQRRAHRARHAVREVIQVEQHLVPRLVAPLHLAGRTPRRAEPQGGGKVGGGREASAKGSRPRAPLPGDLRTRARARAVAPLALARRPGPPPLPETPQKHPRSEPARRPRGAPARQFGSERRYAPPGPAGAYTRTSGASEEGPRSLRRWDQFGLNVRGRFKGSVHRIWAVCMALINRRARGAREGARLRSDGPG